MWHLGGGGDVGGYGGEAGGQRADSQRHTSRAKSVVVQPVAELASWIRFFSSVVCLHNTRSQSKFQAGSPRDPEEK